MPAHRTKRTRHCMCAWWEGWYKCRRSGWAVLFRWFATNVIKQDAQQYLYSPIFLGMSVKGLYLPASLIYSPWYTALAFRLKHMFGQCVLCVLRACVCARQDSVKQYSGGFSFFFSIFSSSLFPSPFTFLTFFVYLALNMGNTCLRMDCVMVVPLQTIRGCASI